MCYKPNGEEEENPWGHDDEIGIAGLVVALMGIAAVALVVTAAVRGIL